MKKILIIFALSFLLIGCSKTEESKYKYNFSNDYIYSSYIDGYFYQDELKIPTYENKIITDSTLNFINYSFTASEEGNYCFYSRSLEPVNLSQTMFVVDVMFEKLDPIKGRVITYYNQSYEVLNNKVEFDFVSSRGENSFSVYGGYYDEKTGIAGYSFNINLKKEQKIFLRVRNVSITDDIYPLYMLSNNYYYNLPTAQLYFEFLGAIE